MVVINQLMWFPTLVAGNSVHTRAPKNRGGGGGGMSSVWMAGWGRGGGLV